MRPFDAYRGLRRCKLEVTMSEDTRRTDAFIEMVTAKASDHRHFDSGLLQRAQICLGNAGISDDML